MDKIKKEPDWSFQDAAVNNIVKDFQRNEKSKNLLVIPTGGGKTIAAIRSINELVKKGFFDNEKKAMWIVHTRALKKQAEDQISDKDNITKFNFIDHLSDILEVKMKADASKILNSRSYDDYRLLIIDEAHHSAAESYKEFFDVHVGILGLTATPSRTDELELDFQNVSYSTTFRELERRRVIIAPEFISEDTKITIDTDSISFNHNANGLEKFNTEARNNFIARRIIELKTRHRLNKIIVFVGTNEHVKDLYKKMVTINKVMGNKFDHVGYIYGNDNNEMKINNDDYLEWHKKINNSILINCRILNEGYDDPAIDTVVMATPTNSILYYMQCIGRAVRSNSEGNSRALVVEMVDRLPNVRYKIDNRWLYAEISDYLEPTVIDLPIIDKLDYKRKISNIAKEYGLDINNECYNNFETDSLLIFNSMPKEEPIWRCLFFSGENKEKYISIFNNVSNNISEYYDKSSDWVIKMILKIEDNDLYFSNRDFKIGFFRALKEAYNQKINKEDVTGLKYITFYKKKISLFHRVLRFFIRIFNK